jgi:uncharacterized membrane protein
VRKFGLVRPILNSWHPGSAKITYWFPTFFSLGLLLAILLLRFGFWGLFDLYILYFAIIGIDAGIKNKNMGIGFLAIYAALVQFFGYGYGFLRSVWEIQILKKNPEQEFPNLFFKNV